MTDPMSARYGRTRRPRWPLVVVIVVLVVAAVAWLVWAIVARSTPKVQSSLTTFDIVGPHRAKGTVEVRLSDPGVRATCLLQAQAFDHSVVGESHFRVPTDKGTDLTVTRTIRTERKATAVVSQGCTAPGQKDPR